MEVDTCAKTSTHTHTHRHTHTKQTVTVPQKTKTTTHTHTRSFFKVIKRGDFKCSYLFGACCRGNRQSDCAGSLEFLSSCGVRPPCVPLPIFPDPDASPWDWGRAGRREERGRQGLEVKHSTLHSKHTHTHTHRSTHTHTVWDANCTEHTPDRMLERDVKSQTTYTKRWRVKNVPFPQRMHTLRFI